MLIKTTAIALVGLLAGLVAVAPSGSAVSVCTANDSICVWILDPAKGCDVVLSVIEGSVAFVLCVLVGADCPVQISYSESSFIYVCAQEYTSPLGSDCLRVYLSTENGDTELLNICL
jgi:hypothetical protein